MSGSLKVFTIDAESLYAGHNEVSSWASLQSAPETFWN